MKYRLFRLILFELKKIINHKKAILFLIALNIVPIIASIALIAAYIKLNGFGIGSIQDTVVYNAVKALFLAHLKLFAFIAPFFLALIVGDSFSTEFNKGYMKMLLLTPISRSHIILAKAFAIIIFLLLATVIGGLLLQGDLFITSLIPKTPSIPLPFMPSGNLSATTPPPTTFITSYSAIQLLFMAFTANVMIVGFYILTSLFFESATIMAFTSTSIIMGIYFIQVISDGFLNKIYPWLDKVIFLCFTRHLDVIFSIESIEGVCNGKLSAFSGAIFSNCMYSCCWAIFFFLVAAFIFSRKHILH